MKARATQDAAPNRVNPAFDPNRRAVLLGVLFSVAFLVGVVQSPVLSAQALSYDDDEFLTSNPLVQNPSWDSATRFASEVLEPSTVRGYYAPLTMISLMFDYGMGGRATDLRVFHRTNLALHLLSTMALVWLIYALTGHLLAAALLGALFGVHPLVVEPLAWIAERKTLLATFFALASLLSYVRHTTGDAPRARWISLVAMILACLAKPTAIVIPGLMIGLDLWPLSRLIADRQLNLSVFVEKIPLFAVSAVFTVITLISHQRTVGLEVAQDGLITRGLTAIHLIVFYLGKVAWPVDLSSVYLLPDPITLADPTILTSIAALTVLTFAVLWVARAGVLAPLAGLAVFVIGLSPTLGGLRYSWVTASDKYVYLPALGLTLVGAWAFARIWSVDGTRQPILRVALGVLVAVLFVAETRTSRAQLAHWQTTEALYRHMMSLTPQFPLIHLNLGEHLLANGRVEEAVRLFYRAIEIEPGYAKAHNNLGVVFWSARQPDRALSHLTQAVSADPKLAKAHSNLGIAYNGMRRPVEALASFERALALDPRDPQSHCGAALSHILLGRPQTARPHYETSLRLAPGCKLPPGSLP